MKKTRDLTQGNVYANLITFALPFLLANFLQSLYSATDMFVVGHFCGPSAITAVNIGAQIFFLITSTITGCAMGTTVSVGTCIGAKRGTTALRYVNKSIIIFVIIAIILTPLLFMNAHAIAVLLQTPPEALAEAETYIRICAMGMPFIVAFNVLAAILRGYGDSTTPMYIVAIAAFFNVGGDFLLTGYYEMGVSGVAIATVAAQLLSSIAGCYFLYRKAIYITPQFIMAKGQQEIRQILRIGLPLAVQNTLIGISFILLTVIANLRGLIDSSSVGVTESIINVTFLFPSAMLSAISVVTAHNLGAGQRPRAIQSLKAGLVIMSGVGLTLWFICLIMPETLASIFTNEPAVISGTGEYLKSYSIDIFLAGLVFCFNGFLCGEGKSLIVSIHTILTTLTFRVPVAYVLSAAYPDTLFPMGLASPLASFMSLVILALYYQFIYKKVPKGL